MLPMTSPNSTLDKVRTLITTTRFGGFSFWTKAHDENEITHRRIILFGLGRLGKLGSVGRALAAWTPAKLWPLGASSPGMWIDPSTTASLYQDSAGTTAISAIGTVLDTSNPVGLVLDRKGGATALADPGIHLSQSTSAARPVASARKNTLVGTATLSTQNVTVTAIPYTISFAGAGTVTASGAHVGALTNGQTFTPTAGTLTLTVAGSVTTAQLERGSVATAYQAVVSDSSYTASGFPVYAKFDGINDSLASATFAAGTISGLTDCLIAVRRDSAANAIIGFYFGTTRLIGECTSGAAYSSCSVQFGTPALRVDGVTIINTAGNLYNAVTPGDFHIVEYVGLDLSELTAICIGNFSNGYQLNGALSPIQLFASGQDANRDLARAQMAAYFGVTLP